MSHNTKITTGISTAMLSILMGSGANLQADTYDGADSFEGWYGGVHVGCGFADSTLEPGLKNEKLGGGGALAGLQAGYNWDEDSWAWGIEADIGPAFMNAGHFGNHYNTVQILGSLRARIGVVRNDNWAYVTAGVAMVHGHDRSSASSVNASFTRAKAVLGIGAEHMINDKISLRAEGLGYFFTNTISVATKPNKLKSIFSARLGVNFHF